MGALEQPDSGLLVGSADGAPAGARGIGRNQPPFGGVGIDQQEIAYGFIAHACSSWPVLRPEE